MNRDTKEKVTFQKHIHTTYWIWDHISFEVILRGLYDRKYPRSQKSYDVPLRKLFLDALSDPHYKAMSVDRYEKIRRHIRFDDKRTRALRFETDKLAPISYIWNIFIKNCTKLYNPSTKVTVDEQLVPFRGRCKFIQYMPSKPAKYGIKIFWMYDSANYYGINGAISCGKEVGAPVQKDLGSEIVKTLAVPIFNSGRNITMDNYFTNVELGNFLLQKAITLVGTIKPNRREIPEALKHSRQRALYESVFGFNNKATLVSYKAKKEKSVILLSAMHHNCSIDSNDRKLKPEIILHYNKTKGGVDKMDEMGSDNSSKRHVGPPLDSVLQNLGKIQNSRERANALFEWLISPVKPDDFFRCIWEKKPALLKRHNSKYYNGFFSTSEFDRILGEDNVQFGVNLDVTSYTDGVRETHNPPGRALPMVVWDYYKNGCSLRLLNPQSFSSTVWNVLSVLQELFGSMVGANTYLTPPSTQGFAPHYDDIEAFVVQLEGKKHWRVYNPRSSSEMLPQFSSVNFRDSDLGEPILETILEAGDLLYFPRGFIHQGDCLPDAHSLHITVSSFQRNSWVDLLDKLLPAALQIAAEDDVQFRQGLPLDYLDYMGVQNAELSDPRRGNFTDKVQFLIRKLAEYAPVDAAVDQKAKLFLHDCLPPVLTPGMIVTLCFACNAWDCLIL
ncbi:unnamed protein product [Ranitomeya imitator]|uniref:Bifunctional lysine-specific demethylase and histidyl-hydroxylase n=1 Tax=Ranitomeya imitator TaxID=111125 RepID=A0ABN9LSJ8_9NEOB|nr:unnamed protein product [Ranitomeya imitator]